MGGSLGQRARWTDPGEVHHTPRPGRSGIFHLPGWTAFWRLADGAHIAPPAARSWRVARKSLTNQADVLSNYPGETWSLGASVDRMLRVNSRALLQASMSYEGDDDNFRLARWWRRMLS
jgi:hypothetical protein